MSIPQSNVSLSNACVQLGVKTVAPFSFSNLYDTTNVSSFFAGATLPARGNPITMGIFRGVTKNNSAAAVVAAKALVNYDIVGGSYSGSGSNVLDLNGTNHAYMSTSDASASTATYVASPKHIAFNKNTQTIISQSTISGAYSTYTIEALFNFNSTSWSWIFCCSPLNAGINGNGAMITANDNSAPGRLALINSSSGTFFIPDTMYPTRNNTMGTSNWTHVVISVNSSTSSYSYYINGMKFNPAASLNFNPALGNVARYFVFGNPATSTPGSITGGVARGRFYTTALTQAEAETLYDDLHTNDNPYKLPLRQYTFILRGSDTVVANGAAVSTLGWGVTFSQGTGTYQPTYANGIASSAPRNIVFTDDVLAAGAATVNAFTNGGLTFAISYKINTLTAGGWERLFQSFNSASEVIVVHRSSTSNDLQFQLNWGGVSICSEIYAGYFTANSSLWRKLIIRWNNSTKKVQLFATNGTTPDVDTTKTNALASNISLTSMFVGGNGNPGTVRLASANIAYMQLFPRALTDAEVSELYTLLPISI